MKNAMMLAGLGFVAAEMDIQQEFIAFVKTFKKEYPTDEVNLRFATFKNNKAQIDAHNNQGESWSAGVNEFSDLTAEEFSATFKGYVARDTGYYRSLNTAVHENLTVNTEIDWRTEGAVTPVKNQGQCGSCWAFSTVGGLEGAHFLSTGKLLSFAEQELVDCAGSAGNQGCNGGLMDDGFTWIKSNGGITTEDKYPYTAKDGTCHKVPSVATLKSFVDVKEGDESDLMAALKDRPVSIAVDAQRHWQSYNGGILSWGCGQSLDHGVLLVGAGTDKSGKDYWLVKNSWGASWGEDGYIRIERGRNLCGISNSASYPEV